ncbi:MAG: hypothetical protein ACRC2H_01030 [Silanimonas sp.]
MLPIPSAPKDGRPVWAQITYADAPILGWVYWNGYEWRLSGGQSLQGMYPQGWFPSCTPGCS